VKLYEELASELNFNVMFSQSGHLTLAHTDSSLRTMRWRAEVNKLEGVRSEVMIRRKSSDWYQPWMFRKTCDTRFWSALHAPGGSFVTMQSLGLCARTDAGWHPHPSENRSDRDRRRE